MSAELFKAGFPAELVITLPCRDYPIQPESRMMHVFVSGCQRGDILDIEAMIQATNDKTYNVEFTTRLLLTKDETGFFGQRLTNARYGLGQNITPDVHHGVRNMTGRVLIEEAGDYWVAMIGYAAATAAAPNDTILLDRGGHMSVLRHRSKAAH